MKRKSNVLGRKILSIVVALAMILTMVAGTVSAADAGNGSADGTNYFTNGDFENNGYEGWTVDVSDDETVKGEWKAKTDEWDSNESQFLQISNYTGTDNLKAEVTQTVTLKPGVYTASIQAAGANEGGTQSHLVLSAVAEGTTLASSNISLIEWSQWNTFSIEFTIEEEAMVTVGVTGTLANSSYCDLDQASLVFTRALDEGGQGEDKGGYAVNVVPGSTSATAGDTITLNISVSDDGTAVEDLAAAGLNLTTWLDYYEENGHGDGNDDAVIASPNDLSTTVTLPSEGTYYLVTELYDSSWAVLTSAITTVTVTAAPDDEDDSTAVEADINVEKVRNLSDDFIMGMDISSVMSEFESGVTYKDFEGNIIDNIRDFCKFLADCGVTNVRVRIWNDPYDSDEHGYGGGNNDIDTAVAIARGCADAGLEMLLDFHCSDFWTDPSKQQTPKAWEGMNADEKAEALSAFLTDSLGKIHATGAEIAMVQVGNETNNAFIGESNTGDMCKLFNAGAKAVHEFDETIKVVIHVTNPESSNMTRWAGILDANQVEYDVLATSYYPSWHGTLANLKDQLQTVKEKYDKDVMVAETSYAFTLDDTDGHDNTIREGTNTDMMTETQYPFTPQGQASFLRDVIDTVNSVGGLGVYYWESAWITVGDTTGLTGEEYDTRVAQNKDIWEACGSGWASSYASEYDPDDAGVWYGGSAVDNQAMFDADGAPLSSINVWKLVRTGAVSSHVSVDAITSPAHTIEVGDSYTLPETVTVKYNNGDAQDPVEWNETDLAAVDPSTAGTYVVNGTVTFSKEVDTGDYAGETTAAVTYTLTVKAPNLIPADVAGFEVADDSDFTISGKGINLPANDDPKEGSHSMHWYNSSANVASATYNTPIVLGAGEYTFEAFAQGAAGDTVTLKILDTQGNVLFTGEPAVLAGWASWLMPSVSFSLEEETGILVQIEVNMQAEGWGTADCLYLYQIAELGTEPEPVPDPDPEPGQDPQPGTEDPSGDISEEPSDTGKTPGNIPSAGGNTTSQNKSSAGKNTVSSPRTGDYHNPAGWIAVLAITGAGLAAVTVYGRKQKER